MLGMSVQFADAATDRPSTIDLASFASRAKEIDIGGDDLVELGDDLGASFLANPNKVAPSPKPMSSAGFGSGGFGSGGFGAGGGDIPQISIKPVADLDDVVNLDAAPGISDIKINRTDDVPFVINTGGSSSFAGGGDEVVQQDDSAEKQRLLTKLQRLEASGLKGQRMTMSNSLADIKAEYDKLTDSRNLEASIRFQRNALMTFVSGVEMVNDKVGHRLPVKPRLKGWSESVNTNIEDFDEIFEELYDLYKDTAKVHPLLRLVGTLGVSATMYHLTNSMAERSGIPGMSDLLNENPELQRQFAAAMASKMGGGLGNFMAAASGVGPSPMSGGGGPAPMGGPPPPTPPNRVPFNAGTEVPRARREMRGPTGVDDILKAFEAERIMSQNASVPISGAHAGVFTPSGPPPTPPRGVSVLREGVGSSVDPLAEFMEDGGSVGTSSTMNPERRRGRRRAAATPVGATLNLNV